jgi:hypothetical protein
MLYKIVRYRNQMARYATIYKANQLANNATV